MVLNLYKPKSISSFNFINKVKKIFGYKKIGHAGTLDPLAEGVLVVLTDNDTKKQNEYMKLDKIYEAEILLGAYSESLDLEKPLNFSEKAPVLNKNQVLSLLESLTGELVLPAPMYSAKLIKGKRLYKYAKQGLTPDEIPQVTSFIGNLRLLSVSSIERDSQNYPLLKVEIECSSGTYIRSLSSFIGEKLHTTGVLYSLKRTKVGNFSIQESQRVVLN